MAYAVERRWRRFRVTLPAIVEFPGATDVPAAAVAGSTRDLGAGGVYVVSQETVIAGLRVRVSVDLGSLGRFFRTAGAVVRTEQDGFAVQFDEVVPDALHLPAATC